MDTRKRSRIPTASPKQNTNAPQISWDVAIGFVSFHIAACIGMYYYPPWTTQRATLVLWFFVWQFAQFGITVGYHRFFCHKSFRASFGVRVGLAIMGSAAFQGSIKWWTLRHRLHHRFVDDPIHDPYAATRGLLYSHMGWIFFKPVYERLHLIEKDDLENDPVVKYQNKYYVPSAFFFGVVLPTLLGSLWGDTMGAFIWGGLVARLWAWHSTFLINSWAHWDGLQPYSDEHTARTNLVMAFLMGGEGNHNFHTFPHDFRAGPSTADWDPTKWAILALHKLGLATGLRTARPEDIIETLQYMKLHKNTEMELDQDREDSWHGENWNMDQIKDYVAEKARRCVLLIDGYAVDVTSYLGEHPGGATLLRKYSVGTTVDIEENHGADWAFNGGLNNHMRSARKRMKGLRIAKLVD